MQQQAEKPSKMQSFVSLQWYDGVISFLFRFVAKTAEPLLAAGVIVSAADFLQKGQLMAHNAMLAGAWSWTQSIAIEASTGPVLVFALQAFKAEDKVKGWLYSVLAFLLFVVGGAMLLLQLMSNATGLNETTINPYILYSLFVLRVIVASGVIALACTKQMHFSGLLTPGDKPSISDETMHIILAKLEKLDALEQHITEHMQAIVIEEQALLQAPKDDLANGPQADDKYAARFESKEQVIADILKRTPNATPEQVAQEAQCSVRTASKWMDRAKDGR